MSITVEATYEQGTLRPVQPLDLAEGAKVRLTIQESTAPSDETLDPLAGVIGICSGGPPDGADNHHKYIYRELHR